MTKQGHSKEDLIEYLLGSLSETDAERFDALSVADTEFADELNAVETDLIDAYVQGQLSGDTLTRFKSNYLASSLRRERVEFARAFQSYGRNPGTQAVEPDIASTSLPRGQAGSFAWLGFFTNQSSTVRWGLAAAAVVLLTVGAWWLSQDRGNQAVASFVLAPSLRGENQIPTLSVERRTAEVRIKLPLESDDYPTYQVALKEDGASTESWRSATLTATRNDTGKVLEVRFPARLLKSKIYSLVVSGIGVDGTVELVTDYPFRADRK